MSPPRIQSLKGKRFDRLVVVRDENDDGSIMGPSHARRAIVRCDCGMVFDANLRSVRRGRTRSCGCLRLDAITKHGLSSHPLYQVHSAMNQRCSDRNPKVWSTYGGRGITVCKAWRGKSGVANFIKWCEANGYEHGLDIDRKDNDKGYSPSNCRFVTRSVNCNNKRKTIRITAFGKKMTFREASRVAGVDSDIIRQRINKLGWPAEKAITKKL